MKLQLPLLQAVLLLVAVISPQKSWAAPFDQQHTQFGKVLTEFVKDSQVDYAGLKAKPADLRAYLDAVAAVPEAEFNQWSRNDQLAMLLNLYNAQTFGLIIDNYPLKSIRDIGVLPQAPWKKNIVRLFGKTTSLYALENDIIRKNYPERPDIHFALVCAAKGCPPLRAEPYVGAKLEQQLADQGREFLGTTAKNRIDTASKTIYLSKIFDWYEDDFKKQGGSVRGYVQKILPAGTPDLANYKIKYTDYDWALNKQDK